MNNLILFINSFLSYLLVFAVFAVAIVVACVLGVTLRRIKNNKTGTVSVEAKEQ